MKKYRKKANSFILAEPYNPGDTHRLRGVSVAPGDAPDIDGGWIAQNPTDSTDRWFISAEFFTTNYEEVPHE